MCGIFAYIGEKKSAANIVLEGLKSLEYRGYDSWGIAVKISNNNTFKIKKRIGKIGRANVHDLPKSNYGFGHTRWATHGGVTKKNSHPHLSCEKSIAIIHNGIVDNYEQIKNSLLKKGHKFYSETDTEVVVHLIEELRKKYSFSEAVRKAFLRIEGLNAIIVADAETKQFVAVRNGSPLVIGFGKNAKYIASDAAALLPHTKKVYFMEDNDLAIITKEDISVLNAKTGTSKNISPIQLKWKVKQAEKGNYKHFMLKEIYQQPSIISEIANTDTSQANELATNIDESPSTYLIGCGTASYACLAGTYLLAKITKRHVNWVLASEFDYLLDLLKPNSLILALSQSGETIDILEAVKQAKIKGAKIFALVNVLGSSLYREADNKTLIGVGPEKAVASTKAFTGMLVHLILLAFSLIGEQKKAQLMLTKTLESAKKTLAPTSINYIKRLARKIKNNDHIFIIGRGLSFPAALETALKIKEITYIHAEGFAAGELKHGVIALIEKGTPCIVFLPQDETYTASLSGAMEMKARGGYIIGISDKDHEVFDYYIPVQNVGEATIIPNVIIGQLLAYYLAVFRKLDPDMPRNLAKSVTVK